MSQIPTFKLSRLRDIGWTHWDPIGIVNMRADADDEYGRYLIKAAAMLWKSTCPKDVIDYLLQIEREYMGMGENSSAQDRAATTVAELATYVAGLRD